MADSPSQTSLEYTLIDSWSSEVEETLDLAFSNRSMIGFDCEGIDLSRGGAISLVQIANEDHSYLLDVLGCNRGDEKVLWLKKILEGVIVKVVHDCRMDSDALYHQLGITLNHVHDTSSWHEAMTKQCRGLNDCLKANGLSGVTFHDKSVYRSNPRFWETRPLTKEMLERAAEDTGALVALAQIQKKKASLYAAKEAESCSLQRTQIWKLLCFEELKPQQIGLFIGKRGANLNALERSAGVTIFQKGNGIFRVYYRDENSLRKVQKAANRKPFWYDK